MRIQEAGLEGLADKGKKIDTIKVKRLTSFHKVLDMVKKVVLS